MPKIKAEITTEIMEPTQPIPQVPTEYKPTPVVSTGQLIDIFDPFLQDQIQSPVSQVQIDTGISHMSSPIYDIETTKPKLYSPSLQGQDNLLTIAKPIPSQYTVHYTPVPQQSPSDFEQEYSMTMQHQSPLHIPQHFTMAMNHQSPMSVQQQSPMTIYHQSPRPMYHQSPMPIYHQSPMPVQHQSIPIYQQVTNDYAA